jgi:uncharacterized protein (TIGR03435 family)
MARAIRWTLLLATSALSLNALSLSAQAPTPVGNPRFEAASIKPGTPDVMSRGITMPGNRVNATNASVRDLVALAYGTGGPPVQRLLNEQIIGGDGWLTSELFNVVATTDSETPPGAAGTPQKLLMLRTLLAERFKLAVHHETRTAPVYVLVLARGDGQLGPKLQSTDRDCQAITAARGGGPPPPLTPGERPPCNAVVGIGPGLSMLMAGGQTMSSLALLFSRVTNRTVIDHTGLSGEFDVDVRFDPEGLPDLGPPGLPHPSSQATSNLPSFFTAIQEQLGLKLNSDRGTIDVLVIDHVERPTPD